MNTDFHSQPRLSPAGVTTAAVLVTIIAMALSTLVPTGAPQPTDVAASSSTQVAQAHHHTATKS